MIEAYKSLEFDVLLNEISKYGSFSLGKELILNLSPSNNTLLIKRNLEIAKEVMAMINLAENYELMSVADISHNLEKVNKDMFLTGLELLKIVDINNSVKEIINAVNKSELDLTNLKDVISSLTILDPLAKSIESSLNSFGEVKDDATANLARLKKAYTITSDRFDATVSNFINRNKDILADSITSTRNNRKVVLLNNNYKNSVKGVIHGESQSGLSVYFEPDAFITINNELQNIAHEIEEEISKVLFSLSQLVKSDSLHIANNLEILAVLDAYLAISKWGYGHNAVVAEISSDHSIELINVAHPLIDPKLVVKNNYQIADGKTLIVSGPNTGGKTVTLKTIALSILMSLCGIPVIADSAKVPIVDNIFVDLGDQQSVVASLSTFSSHLVRLSDIVNNVTKDSLVLLDELGSGTDPKEGQALAVATLEHLRSKHAITLVTTHLSGLKTYAQHSDDIILASVEFDEESLSPTYRFIEGLAGQSNALDIARKFNFPSQMLERAFVLKDELLSDEEKLIKNLEVKEKEYLQNLRKLEAEKEELALAEAAFLEKQAEDALVGSKIIEQAKKDAEKYFIEKQKQADNLYAELLENHKELNLQAAKKIKDKMNKAEDQVKVNKKAEHKFVVNDHVRIDGMQHVGQIVEINGKNVLVNVNGMNMSTKLNKLDYVPMVKPKVKPRQVSISKTSKAKMELNLIGKNVYEAMPELAKFLDNALVNNLSSVIIIHGVGSGVLRKAVHEQLRKHKRVVDFQTAPQSSGGLGATLVNLK